MLEGQQLPLCFEHAWLGQSPADIVRSVHFGTHTSFLAVTIWWKGPIPSPGVQYKTNNPILSSVHTSPMRVA